MTTFFFGVIDKSHMGHYLYDKSGAVMWGRNPLPFQFDILDGGLLQRPEIQGRLFLAVINGWTVMGMWDRTADSRGACNASFIAEGIHTLDQMKEIAARDFPVVWERIRSGVMKCKVNPISSRTCDLGTRSCEVEHQ